MVRIAQLYRRNWLLIRLPIGLLAAALATALWQTCYPMPPRQITITTGGVEGAYHAHARRYAEVFAAHGVDLVIQTSAGSAENLERLRRTEGPADLALVQGGFGYLSNALDSSSGIETLVNVDVEPLWIFTRALQLDSLLKMQGLRVAIGPEGSGTRRVALKLLEQARINPTDLTLSTLTGNAAAQALEKGQLDVVMLIAAPQAESVQNLLRVTGVEPVALRLSAAIAERNPYLETRLLARSALGQALPAQDLTVLTTSASLVARDTLPPALKRLAIAVAQQSHSRNSGLFHSAGELPALRQIDFPTAPQARDVLSQGLNTLERLMPFRYAQWLERMLFIVLPIALLAVWLMHLIPAYLRWTLKSRVNRWYGELKFIENDLRQASLTGIDLVRFGQRLDGIDRALATFTCPNDLVPHCCTLRQHIRFVRQQLYGLRGR